MSFALFTLFASAAFGQVMDNNKKVESSTIVYSDKEAEKMPLALGNNLYCAGYIQKSSVAARIEIVGATNEKDSHLFAEGDALYLNAGASSGVKVGDMFAVIRPRGKVKSEFSSKSGLGIFVQEVGAVEVFSVQNDVAVARVKTSCSEIMMGDLVTPVVKRESPLFAKRGALDLFSQPSGKANGSIVMARDGKELIGSEMIVYVDLGRDENVKIGDYMTIYRPLGTGNIFSKVTKESVDNKEEGYESDRYRGERFSIQSGRKKGENAGGAAVTTEDAKSRRPEGLRRVVGELVVLNVMEGTATAVVVRAATEIHTGDKVELQ